MNRPRSGFLLTWALLIALTVSSSPLQAQIEDPSHYPGVWYRIAFDDDGNRIMGDGDGLGWYYYPTVDRYRMWFNNGVYDPDRKGYLNFEAYIMPVDPSKTSYVEIHYNWTTPEWSALDTGSPPLPTDVPTMVEEVTYMSDHHFYLVENLGNFESIEPVRGYTIQGYNPEWISIDIIGRNARIYRGAWHECQPKDGTEPGGDPDDGDPGYRICCRWSTGDCYVTFGGDCVDSYVALGEGRTCADCIKQSSSSDFGDAPDYPTLLADNGARHTMVSGIFLGRSVDSEIDGQPDATATGDDNNGADEDGVTFTSLLEPGESASVQVVASTLGYLNAWIDFDGDGSFDGPNEQIFADALLTTGAKTLTFAVPEEALVGTTFARFRFNSRGLLSYDGPASDGEVEDYAVQITRHFEPYPTSGVTALQWNQPPAAIALTTPYLFDGVTALSALGLHQIAADDFQLEAGQPVTGIHWWGAFHNWTASHLPPVQPLGFHIGIWTDVPHAGSGPLDTFGHPGVLIWENYCTAWTWAIAGYQEAGKDAGLGETCFQFSCPLSQNQWFHPPLEPTSKDGEQPFYWISIAAIYDTKGPGANHTWGWLTRTHQFSETGTWIQEVTPGPWPPVEGDQWLQGFPVEDGSGVPWDMAFQLTTYGALDTEQKPEPDNGDVKAALDLHNLALAASDWLDEKP